MSDHPNRAGLVLYSHLDERGLINAVINDNV